MRAYFLVVEVIVGLREVYLKSEKPSLEKKNFPDDSDTLNTIIIIPIL